MGVLDLTFTIENRFSREYHECGDIISADYLY